MKPKVLLYQVPLEKAKQLTSALAMMGVRTEQVAPGDIYQKVGYLAGADGCVWAEAPEVQDGDLSAEEFGGEILVMCGFSRMQFEMFMSFFKRKKISPVAIKAMLTDTNQRWTFARLIREVRTEHMYMTRQRG